jgi:hypothetical protein
MASSCGEVVRNTQFDVEPGFSRKIMFKIETEDGEAFGRTSAAATARYSPSSARKTRGQKLAELFPVLVQMKKYAGGKRTRVIRILEDDDDWPQRPPSEAK